MGIIFMAGFIVSLYLIIRILDIAGVAIITSVLFFFSASIFYIVASKKIKQLEKLLYFSLVFLVYLAVVWLYHIT
jgi:amino acid permease